MQMQWVSSLCVHECVCECKAGITAKEHMFRLNWRQIKETNDPPAAAVEQQEAVYRWRRRRGCTRRLDVNITTQVTGIKCRGCQAVMREVESCSWCMRPSGATAEAAAAGNGTADKMTFSVYFIMGERASFLPLWAAGCLQRPQSHFPAATYAKYGKRHRVGQSGRTLLWISQGLAMADRSQAVIIMALKKKKNTTSWLRRACRRACHCLGVSVPTWRSLCVWSPASCTWSSRSSSRRSWTGPRSSGTWSSSCSETERSV